MRFNIFIALFTISIVGCFNSNKEIVVEAPEQELDVVSEILPTFFVEDSSAYSLSFLVGIGEMGANSVNINEDLIVLDGRDSIYLPEFPILRTYQVYTARKEDLAIALSLTRLNYSTIEYKVEMVEFSVNSFTSEGVAELSPYFYLGAEWDEDVSSGESYPSISFSDEAGDCFTEIRVGQIDEPYGLVKLIKNCNGEMIDLHLDNFPTLIEK